MKKVSQVVLLIVVTLVVLYTQMPVIAYGFTGFPLMIAALTVLWILMNLQVVPQITNEMQALKLLTKMTVPKWILIADCRTNLYNGSSSGHFLVSFQMERLPRIDRKR